MTGAAALGLALEGFMRYFVGLIWAFGMAAGPVLADQIVVGSHITAVTVYPKARR